MKMRKIIYFLLSLFAVLALVGCTDKNGDLYSKSKVLKMVKEEVTDESYELDHVESLDEVPKKEIYTFRSKERDFTFTAVNTLQRVYLDGPTGWYTKKLKVNYIDEVQEQYREEIDALWEEFEQRPNGGILYSSFAELENIADKIAQANVIYQRELSYNTEEWLKANPFGQVSVWFRNGEENVSIAGTTIDGCHNQEEIYRYLCVRHASAIKEEKIEDFTTPQEILALGHVPKLKSVYLNYDNVSNLVRLNEKEKKLNNPSTDQQVLEGDYGSYYYTDWDSYIIPLDVGLTDGTYAPRFMEVYLDLLGYSGEIKEKKGEIRWKNGGDKWSMKATVDSRNNITSFDFYKNGKPLHVDYITSESEHSCIHWTYIVGIKAEDFAKIFDVEIKIDEDGSSLQMYH